MRGREPVVLPHYSILSIQEHLHRTLTIETPKAMNHREMTPSFVARHSLKNGGKFSRTAPCPGQRLLKTPYQYNAQAHSCCGAQHGNHPTRMLTNNDTRSAAGHS